MNQKKMESDGTVDSVGPKEINIEENQYWTTLVPSQCPH